MLGLEIRFDLGRYHANPWGSHVNEAATEWPPSPWRLIRALYSTARTNVSLAQSRTAIDRALQALLDAPPPVFELPAVSSAHTRHYMPKSSYSALHRGDTAKVLDGFMAVDPGATLTAWWDAALDAEAADALGVVARALGYLGRSESVCSARMVAGAGPERTSAAPAESVEPGDAWQLVDLLCPQRGQRLEALAVSVTQLRKSRRLVPPGTRRVSYAVSRVEMPASTLEVKGGDVHPTLAVFRLKGSGRPSITEAVAVGQALRNAVQSRYGARNSEAASPTFSGRQGVEPRSDQHRHAHYLALPDGASPRVGRLVVWAPEGFAAPEVEALASVGYLSMRGIPERLPAALVALATESELRLPELLGPARSWRSITPFGLVRHPKVRRGQVLDSPADQVRRELSKRRLPEPDEVTLERGSWHRFRSSKVGQSRLERVSVFGISLRFSEPVPGPLTLGAFSHFGLGLFGRLEQ
ncbi:MAG: type I-U CRISPR-associated protein Csb2 [Actinomycetota bacterium]|nr:type I-U CRISPR-associated protein Csb2 [Actinomycetota bacterium]